MAHHVGTPSDDDGPGGGTVALWPAPLRALAEGDQVLVVGLDPLPDGPVVLGPAPGQRPELLKDAYRRWDDDAGVRPVAEVVERWQVERGPAVEAVLGRTVYASTWAAEALGWTEGRPLHVAAVVVRPAGPDGEPAVSSTVLAARRSGLSEALAQA